MTEKLLSGEIAARFILLVASLLILSSLQSPSVPRHSEKYQFSLVLIVTRWDTSQSVLVLGHFFVCPEITEVINNLITLRIVMKALGYFNLCLLYFLMMVTLEVFPGKSPFPKTSGVL